MHNPPSGDNNGSSAPRIESEGDNLGPNDLEPPFRAVGTPLARIQGPDAAKYAKAFGMAIGEPDMFDLDDPDGRKIFDVTIKFMCLAHIEAERALPFGERIDLEEFALRYRPATYAETLRALAEDIRRERDNRFPRAMP